MPKYHFTLKEVRRQVLYVDCIAEVVVEAPTQADAETFINEELEQGGPDDAVEWRDQDGGEIIANDVIEKAEIESIEQCSDDEHADYVIDTDGSATVA
jgi:hypothetical protein